jgi:hypothetical protein
LPAAAAASLARAIGRRLVNFAAFTRRKLSWMGLLAYAELSQVSIESFDMLATTHHTKNIFMGFGEFLSPLKIAQRKVVDIKSWTVYQKNDLECDKNIILPSCIATIMTQKKIRFI